MKLHALLTLTALLTMLFSVNLHARKPAVEDFVGVETEDYQPTPKGTEVLFDFGNHIETVKPDQITNQTVKTQSNFFVIATIVAFILLPFFMWYGVTNVNRKNNEETSENDQVSPMDNVAKLSDYKNDSKSEDEDVKKAS